MGDGLQLPGLHAELVPHPPDFGRLDLLLLLGREELSQLLVVLELSQHVAHNSLGVQGRVLVEEVTISTSQELTISNRRQELTISNRQELTISNRQELTISYR